MKLTMQTELGWFKFNLSQTSIIYLLGLAQTLEDEGETALPKKKESDVYTDEYCQKDIKAIDYTKNHSGETETSDVTSKTGMDMQGDMGTETSDNLTFPLMGEGRLQEPVEGLGNSLSCPEEKKTWDQNENLEDRYAGADGKYRGFLLIKCDYCGETRGFCAKAPIGEYFCKECGKKTKLHHLRRLFQRCECGAFHKYLTNETADIVTTTCIDCGAPVDTLLDSKRNTYISIGDGTTGRKNNRKRY